MKTVTTLVITLFLIANRGNAQQFINQKDPFTGKQVKSAVVMLGGMIKNVGQQILFTENEGKKYISFMWMGNLPNVNFDKFDVSQCSLLLKMDTDTTFRFKADPNTSKTITSGIVINSEITNDQLQFMSQHQVAIIRFGVKEDAGIDATYFTDKNKKEIQKAVLYFLKP